MRGRVPTARKWSHKVGITPAYAGKRSVKDLGAGGLWDHPRVCGEEVACECGNGYPLGSPPRVRGKAKNATLGGGKRGITPACAGKSCIRCTFRTVSTGSPPRVRGKATPCKLVYRFPGITPACAGKSGFLKYMTLSLRDHPRVCGEKWSVRAFRR